MATPPEVHLRPGWLKTDVEIAQSRLAKWSAKAPDAAPPTAAPGRATTPAAQPTLPNAGWQPIAALRPLEVAAVGGWCRLDGDNLLWQQALAWYRLDSRGDAVWHLTSLAGKRWSYDYEPVGGRTAFPTHCLLMPPPPSKE